MNARVIAFPSGRLRSERGEGPGKVLFMNLDSRVLYDRARILDETVEMLPLAERLYWEAVRQNPDFDLAWTNLGNVRWKLGDSVGARECWVKAIMVDPSQSEALYNLGYVFLETGATRESIPYFLEALKSDSAFADAWFNLGLAYEKEWRQKKAKEAFARYVELVPVGAWADMARKRLR